MKTKIVYLGFGLAILAHPICFMHTIGTYDLQFKYIAEEAFIYAITCACGLTATLGLALICGALFGSEDELKRPGIL